MPNSNVANVRNNQGEISAIHGMGSRNTGSVVYRIIGFLQWFFWLMYEIMITKPLRAFYFEGPIWQNQSPEEICFGMTGVPAKHWTLTEQNQLQCQIEMDRRFHSWERTTMTVVYFTMLSFTVLFMMFSCFRFMFGDGRDRKGGCGCSSNPVTKEELIDIIRQMSKAATPPR